MQYGTGTGTVDCRSTGTVLQVVCKRQTDDDDTHNLSVRIFAMSASEPDDEQTQVCETHPNQRAKTLPLQQLRYMTT